MKKPKTATKPKKAPVKKVTKAKPERSPTKRAEAKGAAFFGHPKLATKARELKGYKPPEAAVHIGEIVSITYESTKKDGTKRLYKHDFTHHRDLYVSVDGSTFIVDPAPKLTKRGIEG